MHHQDDIITSAMAGFRGGDQSPANAENKRSNGIIITADDPAEMPTLEEVERRYVRHVLEATDGNKTRAARVLGVDRRTLYRKIERLDIRSAG